MVFGAIFKRVLDDTKGEAEKRERSPYWVICPACGRRVVKKELMNKGCYLCGWQGTEAELKEAGIKALEQRGSQNSYRTNCPNCGAKVIMQQLQEKGCYICGWKDSG